MKTSDMKSSQFLKQSDVGNGMLVTIAGVSQHNVAQQGADPEMKWCLDVEQSDKPLVLNATNIQLLERICENDDTDFWVGKQVVLYTDPNVSYGGKLVGGIRIRAKRVATSAPAKPGPTTVRKPAPSPVAEPDVDIDADSIPFGWLVPLVGPLTGLIAAGSLLC